MRSLKAPQRLRASISLAALVAAASSLAQAPLPIYTDHLVNGFQDWSWGTRNLANTTQVHSGAASISASLGTWEALSFWHSDLDTGLYSSLSFWAHGGSNGGQRFQAYADYGTSSSGPKIAIGPLPANTWREYVIPLVNLGVSNITNLKRLNLQLTSGSGTFYVDDIQLNALAAPALVHVQVNASQVQRTADARWFGVNAAIWDSNFDTPTTISLLRDMGTRILRFPGGSLSDDYHWAVNKTGTNTWQWATSFARFVHVATNVGAQAFITVNYGSGTAAEAAGWVRHSNVTNKLGFKYWEIGNENYGTWETDTNSLPHHAYTYAMRAKDYFQQMKAADPSIKVGVVAAPGEDSYANNYTDRPAVNPRTGQTHYGWTPILLTTLKSLGVRPDFIVHHHYPQWTGQESDPFLLQSTGNWAKDAADLRQEISDYYGNDGTNIELVVTENNSNSGDQGKQSTSLVNGIYYADSFARLAQTEFNSFVWWDLRNGTDTKGSFDSLLYGWRTYGDLGMINGLSTLHPTFYAAKLMQFFVQPGDSIVSAKSDYSLVSAYAARRKNGSLSLLLINKDPVAQFNTRVAVSSFEPHTNAMSRFYGIPQDEAARTNAPVQAQNLATNTLAVPAPVFTVAVTPLSLTLLSLPPAAPQLAAGPGNAGGTVLLQLRGQAEIPYVLQSSPDQRAWTDVSTNTLSGPVLEIAHPVAAGPGQKFWRALWRP